MIVFLLSLFFVIVTSPLSEPYVECLSHRSVLTWIITKGNQNDEYDIFETEGGKSARQLLIQIRNCDL